MLRRILLPSLFVVCVLALPFASAAQDVTPAPSSEGGGAQRDVALLGVNALLGGVTAGIAGALDGRGFADGFAGGAAGGAVLYAGKRAAAARFDGAGLMGRQVAGIGASMVANAGAGVPLLSETHLHLGPVRLRVTGGWNEWRVRPRLDLPSAAAAVHALAVPGLEFDAGRSLSSGVLVFVSPDRSIVPRFGGPATSAYGLALPGTILLGRTEHLPPERVGHVFAHERIHVLQYDQLQLTIGRGVEERLLGGAAWGRALTRRTDLGLILPPLVGLAAFVPYGDHPWEWESDAFVP